MTLPIPQLDDLAWPDLVSEARDRLPAVAPDWTDHNIHDPGVTILELLAWSAEQLGFRLDQVPDEHRRRFLSLLGDHGRGENGDAEPLPAAALASAARALHAHEELVDLATAADVTSLDELPRERVIETEVPARATTLLDIERVALATPGFDVRRVRAWSELDLAVPCWRAVGTVSVVAVPLEPTDRPAASDELLRAVRANLLDRKTVGTRIRVSGPRYTAVELSIEIVTAPGADAARTVAATDRAITEFLHPLRGGPSGRGWPFGRDVYRTEIMAVVGGVEGVDLAASVELRPGAGHDGAEVGCANLCVPAVDLVALEHLSIEVRS